MLYAADDGVHDKKKKPISFLVVVRPSSLYVHEHVEYIIRAAQVNHTNLFLFALSLMANNENICHARELNGTFCGQWPLIAFSQKKSSLWFGDRSISFDLFHSNTPSLGIVWPFVAVVAAHSRWQSRRIKLANRMSVDVVALLSHAFVGKSSLTINVYHLNNITREQIAWFRARLLFNNSPIYLGRKFVVE